MCKNVETLHCDDWEYLKHDVVILIHTITINISPDTYTSVCSILTALGTPKLYRKSIVGLESGRTSGAVSRCVQTF